MVVLGRIVAPYGLHGGLKIQPFGDDPLAWRKMPQWWLGKNPDSQKPDDWQAFSLRSLREQGKGLVAAFDEVADRNAAEALDGWYVAAPREALPVPAKDEYYWTDLIGLAVVGNAGIALGKVRNLLETGVHDVLEVVDGDTERLIPFVGAYIKEVDLAAGEIQVDWEADW